MLSSRITPPAVGSPGSPNSVQLVTPIHGSDVVPLPPNAVQAAEPETRTIEAQAMRFPDVWVGVVNTLSSTLDTLTSSPKSSLSFRIVYEHEYGSPMAVGVSHTFDNPIPCWVLADAGAAQTNATTATTPSSITLRIEPIS